VSKTFAIVLIGGFSGSVFAILTTSPKAHMGELIFGIQGGMGFGLLIMLPLIAIFWKDVSKEADEYCKKAGDAQ
jgi:hypothetical protein